ncbi:hypothetical protein FPQ18DRAFT_95048 [Pyronema domesticum]|uniref:RGS domain-containing protein n=1 Tax=Pyronema omphalodes (strain CBS 100304) TaxID=1076935 RepID=U4L1Q5_PYROM|nr:hypothetical protein FPQ18DRAFT_95048 [Pyronema domesticum]CCX08474.1 Similar to hypothetical protein NEUTE1DRAFT_126129 [Neurospora tetrasperma FGSC 2508]; acc. no. EGO52664 [Pyronema omphalodes CBS 100304]
MVYNIFTYRRPALVSNLDQNSSDLNQAGSVIELVTAKTGNNNIEYGVAGVPVQLSFENIVNGKTCPPVTCRDFLDYLLHVEHNAENLQFYLWFRDYCERFDKLPAHQLKLSLPYDPSAESLALPEPAHPKPEGPKSARSVQQFVNNAFAAESAAHLTVGLAEPAPAWSAGNSPIEHSPFLTPPGSAGIPNGCGDAGMPQSFVGNSSLTGINYKQVAADAFESVDADQKWQPFSIQPYRDEISRIIAIYIVDGSPRQLNLSDRDRTTALKALRQTTHPSALREVNAHVEDLLRFQSHPNFIRWAICNGNKARGIFAIWLGLFCIVAGIVASIAVTMGHADRGWRVMGAIGWLTGGSTLFAATKGMCVVLHGRHRRHVRPWELWRDEECKDKDGEGKCSVESTDVSMMDKRNSYEDEPWVDKYAQRNILSKIFDKELYIEEPALQQIQDTIAVQSLIIAVVGSAFLTGIFLAVPAGNLY